MQRASPIAVPIAQDLVLVGGGHAHVHVLKRFGMRPVPGVRVTLIARDVETPYSGDAARLCRRALRFRRMPYRSDAPGAFAGARLIHDEAVGLDRVRREVICRDHPPIRYDIVSLDIGITPRRDDVPGAAEHTVSVKPIDRFRPALGSAARKRGGSSAGCASRWSAAAPAGSSWRWPRDTVWPACSLTSPR
jgi:NADH dehydrogenase FAD-containing subunit